ncbi:transcription elongation factor GreA [Flavimobilis marinus]|uniref:Transcription elongation factor GreA n=1 Tax=Flavimobilis marinus TaxID=285351 RepID=A0A1I2HGG5_9MICO|nr:transcription elongation factor GreA [Flavimobilis marinus]GHG57875.1 transcription elongation factor GreA [Flavimobilis marinus]SFF27987.1 transcription elongation factor GreA [Flavimobilis marinus]
MAETTTTTWLTQEAYDRLKAEYDHLTGPGRDEVVDRIARARDEGDLKENAGYHAAREEQAKQEARIRELKQKLESAKVGQPADDGKVEPGMLVTADIAGDETKFLLGSREIAGTTDIDVYSDQSPLGAAINGRSAGDTVTYQAPNGKEITVVIKAAEPFQG